MSIFNKRKTNSKESSVNPEIVFEEDEIIEDVFDEDDSQLIPYESKEIVLSERKLGKVDPLSQYIREVNRYDLLTEDEEKELVKALISTGDVDVAKKLVAANLRLVVKIAMEYRNAHKNVMDLIQEGNIGLMKAVSKYNPEKGAKLSYYASWWIKSYILKFILDNFRLVKIGTTNEQKKLFYNLLKEKDRLSSMGIEPTTKEISKSLGVSEKSVAIMEKRLSHHGGESSIDKSVSEGSNITLADILPDLSENVEEKVAGQQELDILRQNLDDFIGGLKERDQEIFKKRLLSEMPQSLQSIADDYGVSRERIRQIEVRLLENLKVYMSNFIR